MCLSRVWTTNIEIERTLLSLIILFIFRYEGYFNLAKEIYRIDAPIATHNIGRDWEKIKSDMMHNCSLSF